MATDSLSDRQNKKLGRKGESAACRYLKKNGYKILARNYKNPFGEVDVIAERDGTIAFIEVKTRLSDSYGVPSESVTERRKRKYVSAANYFFTDRQIDCVVRFDVIEIFRGEINHIENAFTS